MGGADYTIWKDNLPEGDGDEDGNVDSLDYDIWADNYAGELSLDGVS